MTERLSARVTALTGSATAVAAALAVFGGPFAVTLALVALAAFLGWTLAGDPSPEAGHRAMMPYLAAIPLFLVLQTIRFASGWPGWMRQAHGATLPTGFAFSDALWFFAFVCLPVCVMMLGAVFTIRRRPLGYFLIWAMPSLFLAETVLQLRATTDTGIGLAGAAALLTAGALLLLGVRVVRHLLTEAAAASSPQVAPLTTRQVNLWSLLFLACVIVYAVNIYGQAGAMAAVIIVGSMIGGLIGWRATTARRPVDPAWAVPTYLTLLTLFYLHVGEEALTGFAADITSITGKDWSEYDFFMVIALLGPIVWVLAGWSLWRRQPLGNFVMWFMMVGMIMGEHTHLLVFPTVRAIQQGTPYAYFGGMYSALFPMIPAIAAVARILRDRKDGAPA